MNGDKTISDLLQDPVFVQNFHAGVSVGDPTACWPWTRAFDDDGYGVITRRQVNKQRIKFLAHRVAWTVANGSIPPKMLVCHKCDNPPCCNPDHLFCGTVADNNRDKCIKGRGACGEAIKGKLTAKIVAEMRKLFGKTSYAQIGRDFGVSKTTVHHIAIGRIWKHVR